MLARGTATPVLATYDNLADALTRCLVEGWLVHDEVCHGFAVGIVADVVHEGIAIELRVTRGERQETGRDDVVRIIVVDIYRQAGGLNYIEFFFSHFSLYFTWIRYHTGDGRCCHGEW